MLLLVGIGLLVGVAAALSLARVMPPDLLPNVSARGPADVGRHLRNPWYRAVVATLVPPRRATKIDPLLALRAQ